MTDDYEIQEVNAVVCILYIIKYSVHTTLHDVNFLGIFKTVDLLGLRAYDLTLVLFGLSL